MHTAVTLVLIFLCLPASALLAGQIEIPLMELTGEYPLSITECERINSVDVIPKPYLIHSASIRITGYATVGSVACDGGDPVDWPLDFSAYVTGAGNLYSSTICMPGPGFFSWTSPLTYYPAPDFSFMMSGPFLMRLYGAPATQVGICGVLSGPPAAEVNEAVLILDAEFPTPTDAVTWSRLKALYN